ncbi:MAG: hypothetical protein KDD94_11865, partial [Calditrichaeota bacterium]|nr:hypothetical protein [Calditrichota bacterium]
MRFYFVFCFIICSLLFSQNTQAYQIDSETTYLYDEPGTFEFFANVPRDYGQFFNQAFKKEYTTNLILIGASTALLIAVDQPLYDETARLGRQWGIGNE